MNSPQETDRASRILTRAWVSVALIPVFLILSLVVGYAGYALLGYQPESNDQPLWVDIVVGVPTLAVFLAPCLAAAVYGRRAAKAGDGRGLWPAAIGSLVGVAMTALTVVTIGQTAMN